MISDALVLLGSMALIFLMSTGIVLLTRGGMKNKEEMRVGLIGALVFGYIAWACTYMSQIKPFVNPE